MDLPCQEVIFLITINDVYFSYQQCYISQVINIQSMHLNYIGIVWKERERELIKYDFGLGLDLTERGWHGMMAT